MLRASGRALMPSCLPSASTRRTSRARIRSLIRGSLVAGGVVIGHHSYRRRPLHATGAGVGKRKRPPLGTGEPGAHASGAEVDGWEPPKRRAPLSVSVVSHKVPAMSTLWTPGGERPVPRPGSGTIPTAPPEGGGDEAGSAPPGGPGPDVPIPSADEVAQVEELRRQLTEVPAEVVIANHCYGLFELAALHLSDQPPRLEPARLAIDALAAVVEALDTRLGPAREQLADALAQIRMAFVQISAAPPEQAPPEPARTEE